MHLVEEGKDEKKVHGELIAEYSSLELYIVKRILKRIEGNIDIENVENGAQFTIVLPAYRE